MNYSFYRYFDIISYSNFKQFHSFVEVKYENSFCVEIRFSFKKQDGKSGLTYQFYMFLGLAGTGLQKAQQKLAKDDRS